MRRFRHALLASFLAACSALPALAAPIAPSHVDASAKWYGHIDCDAVRGLPLVSDWLDKLAADPAKAARIEEVTQRLGIDPTKDVNGVTFYSSQYEQHNGVALVYVRDADAAKLEAALKAKHPEAVSETYGNRTLYSWESRACGREQKKVSVTGSIARNDLIIVGGTAAQVQAALDVLDGKKPGLLADSPLLSGQTENALFSARALDVPANLPAGTQCPVLRVAQAAEALWTRKEDQLTGRYAITTQTVDQAAAYKAMLDGFKAMALARTQAVPAVKQLFEAVSISADAGTLLITWTGTTQDVQSAMAAAKAAGWGRPKTQQ